MEATNSPVSPTKVDTSAVAKAAPSTSELTDASNVVKEKVMNSLPEGSKAQVSDGSKIVNTVFGSGSTPVPVGAKAEVTVLEKALNSEKLPSLEKSSSKSAAKTGKVLSNFIIGKKDLKSETKGTLAKVVASTMSNIPRFVGKAQGNVAFRLANIAWGGSAVMGGAVVLCAASPAVVPCAVARSMIHSKFGKTEKSEKSEAQPMNLNSTETGLKNEIASLRERAQAGEIRGYGIEIPSLKVKLADAEEKGLVSKEFVKHFEGELSKANEDEFSSRIQILKGKLAEYDQTDYQEARGKILDSLATDSKDKSKNISKEFKKNAEGLLNEADKVFSKIQENRQAELKESKNNTNLILEQINNKTLNLNYYVSTFKDELGRTKDKIESLKQEKDSFDKELAGLNDKMTQLLDTKQNLEKTAGFDSKDIDKAIADLSGKIDNVSQNSDECRAGIENLERRLVTQEKFVDNLPKILEKIDKKSFSGLFELIGNGGLQKSFDDLSNTAQLLDNKHKELSNSNSPNVLKDLEDCQAYIKGITEECHERSTDPLTALLLSFYVKPNLVTIDENGIKLQNPNSLEFMTGIMNSGKLNNDKIADFIQNYHKNFLLEQAKTFGNNFENVVNPNDKAELNSKLNELKAMYGSRATKGLEYITKSSEFMTLLEKQTAST